MDHLRKPRRVENADERAERIQAAEREAMNRALSEQDKLDALVRRSIEAYGA